MIEIQLLDWLTGKEADSMRLMELSEVMGDTSDYDYYQGLYEAYGCAKAKLEGIVNG